MVQYRRHRLDWSVSVGTTRSRITTSIPMKLKITAGTPIENQGDPGVTWTASPAASDGSSATFQSVVRRLFILWVRSTLVSHIHLAPSSKRSNSAIFLYEVGITFIVSSTERLDHFNTPSVFLVALNVWKMCFISITYNSFGCGFKNSNCRYQYFK